MFSCKVCEIFKNIFFIDHLLWLLPQSACRDVSTILEFKLLEFLWQYIPSLIKFENLFFFQNWIWFAIVTKLLLSWDKIWSFFTTCFTSSLKWFVCYFSNKLICFLAGCLINEGVVKTKLISQLTYPLHLPKRDWHRRWMEIKMGILHIKYLAAKKR